MCGQSDSHDELLAAIATNLRIDAATAEVLRAFAAEGIQARLLKGPALARWLYTGDEHRFYADCDLLVRPRDHGGAERVLAHLGFVQALDGGAMPEWWREHADDWWRADDAVAVDLHRRLPGIEADADTTWAVLAERPHVVPVAAFEALVLAPAGRALHVVLHAAQHGVQRPAPLRDLELTLALAAAEPALWLEAATLARRLDAVEAFASGLALLPAGRELAAQLDLAPQRSVDATLRARGSPPTALGFEQLARAPGTGARLGIAWRKLFPPPEFVRRWHPLAARGRTGLLLAYLYRPVWLVRAAPRGLRAWRSARRAARGRD